MPGRTRVREELEVAHGSARSVEKRKYLGLGVERIETLRLARLPAARLTFAREQQPKRRTLIVAEITASDLEQPRGGYTAIEVAARCCDQAREQRGAHDLHVLADRVRELPLAAAKDVGLSLGDEAPRHSFVKTASGRGAAHPPLHQLRT